MGDQVKGNPSGVREQQLRLCPQSHIDAETAMQHL